jgi:hypothetical protein
MEYWRPVVGFEGQYEVSSAGHVRRCARVRERSDGTTYTVREQELRQVAYGHKRNYLGVGFKVAPRVNRVQLVHRLVADAFLPNPESLPAVNHKNLDKLDNRVENLEWCTYAANQQHAADRGRYHGRTNPNARRKLEPMQVDSILNRLAKGETHRTLAAAFGVSMSMIQCIKQRRSWQMPGAVCGL